MKKKERTMESNYYKLYDKYILKEKEQQNNTRKKNL